MEKILLEIVTPERKVLAKEVDEVTLPGAAGELGVLPGHTELLSLLKPGRLQYRDGTHLERFAVAGGFVEVGHKKVVVLADAAEASHEIDVARAKAARAKAEKMLADLEMTDQNWSLAESALQRALNRLDLAEVLHH